MAEKDVQAVLNEVVRRANETVRRLRDLEEKDSLIENRLNTAETTILNLTDGKRELDEKFTLKTDEIEKNIMRIDNELLKINKISDKMAKKSEMKELENMISIYNPIKTNFITKEDVELMIEERLKNVSVQ
jgi:hypothetical protein